MQKINKKVIVLLSLSILCFVVIYLQKDEPTVSATDIAVSAQVKTPKQRVAEANIYARCAQRYKTTGQMEKHDSALHDAKMIKSYLIKQRGMSETEFNELTVVAQVSMADWDLDKLLKICDEKYGYWDKVLSDIEKSK